MDSRVENMDFGPNEHRLVYSVGEAGELLGISRAFAYELAARGELPVIRMGRRLLVPKAALLALVGAATELPTAR
jgi:excisionase family DNA binding protein